jgi:hypothetical protein
MELVEGLGMSIARNLGKPLVAVIAAAAFQALVIGVPAVATTTIKPIVKSTSKPNAKSTSTKSTAKRAVSSKVPKSPVTISITSHIRQGTLVVSLDDVPVFNEEFRKPVLLIAQTTKWDPFQIPAGKHKLTAKVYGQKGKTYQSGIYELVLSRTKGIEIRIRMKGDALTVEPVS